MSLKKCSMCGHDISEFAYKCPGCGNENRNRKQFTSLNIESGEYEKDNFSYSSFIYEEKRRKEKRKKIILKILCTTFVISLILISGMYIRSDIKRQKENEKVQRESLKIIDFMCSLVGEKTDDNGDFLLESDDKIFLDPFSIFGIDGKLDNYSYMKETRVIIMIMWKSKESCSDDDLVHFVNCLEEQFGDFEYYDEEYYYNKVEELVVITAYKDESNKVCLKVEISE